MGRTVPHTAARTSPQPTRRDWRRGVPSGGARSPRPRATSPSWRPAGSRPVSSPTSKRPRRTAGQPDTVTVTRSSAPTSSPRDRAGPAPLGRAPPRSRLRVHRGLPYDPRGSSKPRTPGARRRRVAFEHIRDNGGTRELVVPGDISLTVDGRGYTLSAFDDDGTLLLVSATPPTATHLRRRTLPLRGAHRDDGRVRLDFNRAFVPPADSPTSTTARCRRGRTLPPAVEAGEKRPVFRDGSPAQR